MEIPDTAIILAAGRGRRMGALTKALPKPLLEVGGRTIIDRALDRLVATGVRRVVVNLHHEAALLRGHLSRRDDLALQFSDESGGLLDTGGGIANALHLLGDRPFYVINGDVLWFDNMGNSLQALAARFLPARMDALLLLQPTVGAIGYNGIGDFVMDPDGKLTRRPEREVAPFIYTGVQILRPELFQDCPDGPFSLNHLYDRAEALDRLFGLRHEGEWMELNRPEGLAAAARALLA